MPVCTGQGANGSHCCYIGGQVCYYLDDSEPTPRCSLLVELGSWDKVHKDRRWKRSVVGVWFKDRYPGYGCGDWPQNIPEVMNDEPDAGPFYACCWGRGNT